MSDKEKKMEHRKPTTAYGIFSLALVLLVCLGASNFLNAPIKGMFFVAWLVIIPLCMYLGYSYNEIWEGMMEYCKKGLGSIIILLAVGAIIGTWTACGAVPSVIYFGLSVISPKVFLLTTFILCSCVSLACGTSWGTLGTAGIAMFAIGESMGIPAPMTVGAIVSGSYMGDMVSPMSDSTNVAAASVETDLITHCKELVRMVVPIFLVSSAVYYILGIRFAEMSYDASYVKEIMSAMSRYFHMNIIALLPMILLFVLLFLKKPAIPSMLISALAGCVVALYQGAEATNVLGYFWNGYSIETGQEFLDTLLNRGGVTSMFETGSFMLFCFAMVGAFNTVGILEAIIHPISSKAKNVVQLTGITQLISIVGNFMGTNCFTLMMTGTLMAPAYKKMKLHPTNCSKVMNCTSTVIVSLIPWSADGIFITGLFGISTLYYGLYSVYAYVAPILVFVITCLGFRVIPADVHIEKAEKYNKKEYQKKLAEQAGE